MLKTYYFCLVIWLLHGQIICFKPKISYFEELNYDISLLSHQHERLKRSLVDENLPAHPINLNFTAHGTFFDIYLSHDKKSFHKNFELEDENGVVTNADLSHIYQGYLQGLPGSNVHGSIINSIFRGVIHHPTKGNFYIDEAKMFFKRQLEAFPVSKNHKHSVIYQAKDTIAKDYGSSCRTEKQFFKESHKFNISNHKTPTYEKSRLKRELNTPKDTCLLFIESDWVIYNEFKEENPITYILSTVAEHVSAVNEIYRNTAFGSLPRVGFMVKRMRINKTKEESGEDFSNENIGIEKFLEMSSSRNHDDYCLSYAFTTRDFAQGVLGLAFVADQDSGGICDKYRKYSGGRHKSLNTGVISLKNYGSIVPSVVSHLTFAHELGHSLGALHDHSGCVPANGLKEGNFIMYPKATSGLLYNNDKFSSCSIENITRILEARKDICFIAVDESVCGNGLIDKGEDCDCGYEEQCLALGDRCCTPADSTEISLRCKLKKDAVCSISQSACCNPSTCKPQPKGYFCGHETECSLDSTCDGTTTKCNLGEPKKSSSIITCDYNTKVCLNGVCNGTKCNQSPELESCECSVSTSSRNRSTLCHTCCQVKGTKNCKSIAHKSFRKYISRVDTSLIYLHPGSPCDNYKGYCDIFAKCRPVDSDGAISLLKSTLLDPSFHKDLREWLVSKWWVLALSFVGFVFFIFGFIKVCSVNTPYHNPELRKKSLNVKTS